MDQVPQSNPSPAQTPPRVDWWLGLIVGGLLVAVAVPGIRTAPEHAIDEPSVERLASLIRLARDEAVASGDEHFLFLERPEGEGGQGSVLLFRDIDGDSKPSEVEVIGSLPLAPARWGSAFAVERAIGDAGVGLRGPWSFDAQSRPAAMPEISAVSAEAPTAPAPIPSGIRGIVFDAAGVPHRIESNGLRAEPGSGAGSLYLRTSERDFAIVLSPWGDVDVQLWDGDATGWQVAHAR